MPSSATVTAFNVFESRELIRSSQVNENFSNFRGHLVPIDPNTATAADSTYDLGAFDNRWKNVFANVAVLTGQSTPAANPTTGQYKVYMKSDGILYRLNSAGAESAAAPSVPLTTKGDMPVHDGSATVRFPIGSNGKVLTADSSATAGMKWATPAAGSPIFSVRSVTTTDSPTNSDDVLSLSGSSFTLTLFTAVGNTGKVITIIHGGTSLSQVYTLNTTSSQTIGGIASGVYKLSTNRETLRIVSDGTNWIILDHKTITAIGDQGSAGYSWSSNTTSDSYWRRLGDVMELNVYVRTLGAPDTVTLTVTIPGSGAVTIDSTRIADNTTKNTDTRMDSNGKIRDASAGGWANVYVNYNSSTTVTVRYLDANAAEQTVTQAAPMTWANGDELWLYMKLPIAEWQP